MRFDSVVDVAPEPATRVWEVVSDHLEAFARSWEAGGPPDVRKFAPTGPPAVRRLALVELVKLDLDTRLQRGVPRMLEEYFAEFPELVDSDGPPCDLLYEDFHLRRSAGLDPDPADYFRRFPGRASELARLLGGTVRPHSTSAFPTRVPTDINPGNRLDDFDLLALLGEGQFARVFLARQRSMQRLVALKVSGGRGAEAETLAQLDHPHIVRVYDQRFLPDRGLLLVYMPYLPGGTLGSVLERVRSTPPDRRSGRLLPESIAAALERRGELPPVSASAKEQWAALSWAAVVCKLGAKLASALDYAHRRGVMHRDVKPANVLLTADGEPMLADFHVGCCTKLEGAGPAAFFGGSLAYMSVEHLEAFDPAHEREPDSLDGRADVFSLAVTLWELLTGHRPFGIERLRESWTGTLASLVEVRKAGPKPEAVALFPDDVPGLKEVLLRCLDADPAKRPATAGELARELELCLRPATRDLLRPKPDGWRARALRHPMWVIYPAGLSVNLLASWFNVLYNQNEINAHWATAKEAFDQIVPIVNGIMFPLGMILYALAILPVTRGLRRIREGNPPPPDELARLRGRALRLGAITTAVCVGCWVAAGVVWPIALRVAAGPPTGPGSYLHFLVSLTVCGLIAAAYPYFIVTFLAVRVLYPALLGPEGPTPSDARALRRVDREMTIYRVVAAAVPLLTVALLALMMGGKVERDPTNADGLSNTAAVAILSAAGLFGVVVAYLIEGRIRADIAALSDVPRATHGRGDNESWHR